MDTYTHAIRVGLMSMEVSAGYFKPMCARNGGFRVLIARTQKQEHVSNLLRIVAVAGGWARHGSCLARTCSIDVLVQLARWHTTSLLGEVPSHTFRLKPRLIESPESIIKLKHETRMSLNVNS